MRHVSETQIRHWLDETAIRDVTAHTDEDTEFNCRSNSPGFRST